MVRGGSRNRSGPAPVEGSGRSERRGYSLQALPAAGFGGPVPGWPLPRRVVKAWVTEDKSRYQVVDQDATDAVAAREAELWAWAWRTPQACAWSLPTESWRAQIVARWVRQAVLCESSDSSAADHGQLHRYADQVGLTTAGLREMGWKIVAEPVKTQPVAPDPAEVPERRVLRAVHDVVYPFSVPGADSQQGQHLSTP